MFVLPEPLGPTMAVTPPSNWISVCRAKVLKPSNCRDLKNKLAGRVADVGVNRPSDTTGVGAALRPALPHEWGRVLVSRWVRRTGGCGVRRPAARGCRPPDAGGRPRRPRVADQRPAAPVEAL